MPLTPLQQGLLFHASTTQGSGDLAELYAVQLDITVTGPLDPHRLREAVHTVVNRHPNLAARFCPQFDEPVQTHPGRSRDGLAVHSRHYRRQGRSRAPTQQIQQLCAAERAAVCDLADPPAFRVALIRTATDRHRVVLTNHHIVLDGWSTADPAAGDLRQLTTGSGCPRPASYRRFVTWLADRDLEAAHAAWRRGARRLRQPHPGRPAGPG